MFPSSGVVFLVLAVLSAISLPDTPPTGRHCGTAEACSLLLDVGMTEKQVMQVVGRSPTSAEVQPCGSGSDPVCKVVTYPIADGCYFRQCPRLAVYEKRDNGEWHVNGWKIQ